MSTVVPQDAIPFTFTIESLGNLTLFHRPNELAFARKKRQNSYLTRGGWVHEMWGEELTEVSGGGYTDGFLHPVCGYTRVQAAETGVYQEFLQLIAAFRHNGFTYSDDGQIVEIVDPTSGMQRENVILEYRDSIYRGYFESLTWEEEDEKPFQFHWEVGFRVIHTLYGY